MIFRYCLDLFLNSRYSVEKGDKRFVLNKVNGNNKLYDYSTDVTYVDGVQVVKLNGGFYQGFFKSDDERDGFLSVLNPQQRIKIPIDINTLKENITRVINTVKVW